MSRLAFRRPFAVLALTAAPLPAWAQFIDAPGPRAALAGDCIGRAVPVDVGGVRGVGSRRGIFAFGPLQAMRGPGDAARETLEQTPAQEG